jgi:4-alpha-glucanotransferase
MLETRWAMKRAAVSSILVAVVLLTLGVTAEARMNVPGRAEGNWSWRCTEEMMSAADFDSLRELTKSSNRLGTLRRYGKLEETL